MKQLNLSPTRAVSIILGLVTAVLVVAVLPDLNIPLPLYLAIPVIVVAAVVLLFNAISLRGKQEDADSTILSKVVAALIVAALVASTYTAIKSLWIGPWDPSYDDKFIYENVATGTGFATIVLVFILSALQKDIYWVTRRNTVRLDERLIKERQQVFETSYKLGAFLVLIVAGYFAKGIRDIQPILANSVRIVPDHLAWLGYHLSIALFALPLIIAAWRKK
jgi:uncharacterized membrane protein (UPF0182 family)